MGRESIAVTGIYRRGEKKGCKILEGWMEKGTEVRKLFNTNSGLNLC